MDNEIEIHSDNIISSAFVKRGKYLSVFINTVDRWITPDTTESGDGYITWWFDEEWVKVYVDKHYFVFTLHDKNQIWFLLMPSEDFSGGIDV